MIPSVLLAASFKLRSLCSSHKLIAIRIFHLNMNILKIILENVFCNETLSNLENFLQRNLTTERARKSIFWVSGGTNFGSFSRRLHGFEVCTSLPKKSLDTSLLWFSYVFLCKKGTLAWNRRLMLWTNTNSCYNTSLFANEKKKKDILGKFIY